MKKIVKYITLFFVTVVFISCANVDYGYSEEYIFRNETEKTVYMTSRYGSLGNGSSARPYGSIYQGDWLIKIAPGEEFIADIFGLTGKEGNSAPATPKSLFEANELFVSNGDKWFVSYKYEFEAQEKNGEQTLFLLDNYETLKESNFHRKYLYVFTDEDFEDARSFSDDEWPYYI